MSCKEKGETKEDISALTHWNQGPDKALTSWWYNSSNWCRCSLLHSRGNCISGFYSTAYFVSLANTTSIMFSQGSINYSPSIFTLFSPVLSIKYKQMFIVLENRESIHNAEWLLWFKHFFSKDISFWNPRCQPFLLVLRDYKITLQNTGWCP